eukprot:GEMP01016973.1.p1 GENE.GEMP01016973.1~~GEMP01016973.1.p1  ORF type:complete len:543 (+),score=91.48 GEMP01016973.1:86-1714(+)
MNPEGRRISLTPLDSYQGTNAYPSDTQTSPLNVRTYSYPQNAHYGASGSPSSFQQTQSHVPRQSASSARAIPVNVPTYSYGASGSPNSFQQNQADVPHRFEGGSPHSGSQYAGSHHRVDGGQFSPRSSQRHQSTEYARALNSPHGSPTSHYTGGSDRNCRTYLVTPQGEPIPSQDAHGSQERRQSRTSTMISTLLASAADMFGLSKDADKSDPRHNGAELMTTPTSGRDAPYMGFVAAKTGNVGDLERALQQGLDINAVDSSKFTMLAWAARTGAVPTAKLLLERGANPNLSGGPDMPTPLIVASKHGYTEVAELLLKYYADPNKRDDKMHTPLIFACANGHYNTTRLLLDSGANPHLMARSDANIAQPIDMSSIDNQFRLEPGTRAALDWQESSDGKTAIHCAARYGHAQIVDLLLGAGVNPDAQDDKGKTSVFWAAYRGHIQALCTLLNARAEVDLPDNEGNTPLMWACRLGKHEAAKVLIEYGADPNYHCPKEHARGPLTWAIQYGDTAMVSLLKNEGAAIRSPGITPRGGCNDMCSQQ